MCNHMTPFSPYVVIADLVNTAMNHGRKTTRLNTWFITKTNLLHSLTTILLSVVYLLLRRKQNIALSIMLPSCSFHHQSCSELEFCWANSLFLELKPVFFLVFFTHEMDGYTWNATCFQKIWKSVQHSATVTTLYLFHLKINIRTSKSLC